MAPASIQGPTQVATQYLYKVTHAAEAAYKFCSEPPEKEVMEDASIVFDRSEKMLARSEAAHVCRFVRRAEAPWPLYVGKKHKQKGVSRSIVIIPDEIGKTVFVSLRRKLSGASSEDFKFKRVIMLQFDQSGRVIAAAPIIKLVTCFTSKNPRLDRIVRRVSVMQQLDDLGHFPNNFGYVVVASRKLERKLCIYEEPATCDLHDYLGMMPPKTLPVNRKSIMGTAVGALSALKTRGIIYRDLKLQNILVFQDKNGAAHFKLTDVGLAIDKKDIAQRKRIAGTAGWAAPELLKAFREGTEYLHDDTCDLWSLGLVIYFLFYQNVPPVMSTSEQVIDHPKNEEYWKKWEDSLNALPPKPDRVTSIKDLIPALLQPDPKHRIHLEELQEILPTLL